jgi:superfamily II DNA or RNA helicase
MSIIVNIDNIPWEIRNKINSDLEIKIENKFSGVKPRFIYPFEIEENNIILPFAYALTKGKIKRPTRESLLPAETSFEGVLRPEQKEVRKEAIKQLSISGSILLSMYCGFGKSATSMKIASDIGLKTLIIVNKIILIKQWEEGINIFCPKASVQKITTKSKQEDCDFYIINAQNVEKMGRSFFSDIGTVIVDEAHLIMAETLSRCLQWVHPRYLIGLTATPYRVDGLNLLLDFYFGKYKIIRTLFREHIAYKVLTKFKPTVEKGINGRVNWSSVLESQANNIDRNELIIKILKHHKDRNFLVLTKRVSQGEYLVKRLIDEGEDVTSLFGSNQEYNVSSRILVGTNSKCGTGFDHAKMDALLLACDLEQYFVQYLGRVFRTKDVKPIIFDLVDDYSLLSKHFNTRQKIYRELGGEVRNFDINILKN